MTNRETSEETLPTAERVRSERVDHYPGEGVVERPVVERPVVERPVVEQRVVHEPAYRHVVAATSPVDTARRIVWLAFGVLQALLILRIVLLMLGANEANDLVAFILGVTDPFVAPFRGMFSLDSVDGASGSVLDVAAVVALIAWTLVEALVLGLVGLADRRATTA